MTRINFNDSWGSYMKSIGRRKETTQIKKNLFIIITLTLHMRIYFNIFVDTVDTGKFIKHK